MHELSDFVKAKFVDFEVINTSVSLGDDVNDVAQTLLKQELDAIIIYGQDSIKKLPNIAKIVLEKSKTFVIYIWDYRRPNFGNREVNVKFFHIDDNCLGPMFELLESWKKSKQVATVL